MNDKIKVLIGDNSMDFGINCATILNNFGMYTITRPNDGEIILEEIKRYEPDIVLIDTLLKNINTSTIIKNIRSCCIKQPKFIVTTAYDNPIIEKEVMQSGADYYMLKPFDTSSLATIINNFIYSNYIPLSPKKYADMEITISNTINMFGIPKHTIGYIYVREAIAVTIEFKSFFKPRPRSLYFNVANKFNSTPSRVERSIRKSIDFALNHGCNKSMLYIFGLKKPSNTKFINYIADQLMLNYKFYKRDV